MRARMRAAMQAQEKREEKRDVAVAASTAGTLTAAPFGWKAMLPLTAAAALALVWGAASQRSGYRSANGLFVDTPAATTQAGMGEDPLADLVAEHSRPLPPERTDALGLSSFEQYVGVPVHAANLEKAGARLVGGRVLPVHQERAAMLQYVVGKGADARRVSMFIYDPRKIRIGCNDCAPRAAGTAEVQVGRGRWLLGSGHAEGRRRLRGRQRPRHRAQLRAGGTGRRGALTERSPRRFRVRLDEECGTRRTHEVRAPRLCRRPRAEVSGCAVGGRDLGRADHVRFDERAGGQHREDAARGDGPHRDVVALDRRHEVPRCESGDDSACLVAASFER